MPTPVFETVDDKPVDAEEIRKLANLAQVEEEPLFFFKTVFPFDFFPDEITVYRNKISVKRRTFFFIAQTTNVPIENINYVTVHNSLIFASIEISDRYFSEQPVIITHLHLADAKKAMKIIDGLRLAVHQKIDVTKIPKQKLLGDVLKVGVASR